MLKHYVEYANAKAVFGETLFDLRNINEDIAQEMFVRMNAEKGPFSDERFNVINHAWLELNELGYTYKD